MLIRSLVLVASLLPTRAAFGQVGPVIAFALDGSTSPLGSAARAVYDRAGGYPATLGGSIALGIGSPNLRVMVVGATAPATINGTSGSQSADRQSFGLRVEALRPLSEAWALIGSAAVTRQRFVRTWVAPLPGGDLDVVAPPGPGQRSDDFLSWSATGGQLGVGAERRVSRRLRLRGIAGLAFVGAQSGNWERFTTARGGTRVTPTVEFGVVSLFGSSR